MHVEWGEAFANVLVIEGVFVEVHTLEIRVVDFDAGGAEVGDVKYLFAIDFAGGHALVDRAVL